MAKKANVRANNVTKQELQFKTEESTVVTEPIVLVSTRKNVEFVITVTGNNKETKKGYVVESNIDVELAAYKTDSSAWSVTELSSGLAVSTCSTMKSAVEQAEDMLNRVGVEGFKFKIDQALELQDKLSEIEANAKTDTNEEDDIMNYVVEDVEIEVPRTDLEAPPEQEDTIYEIPNEADLTKAPVAEVNDDEAEFFDDEATKTDAVEETDEDTFLAEDVVDEDDNNEPDNEIPMDADGLAQVYAIAGEIALASVKKFKGDEAGFRLFVQECAKDIGAVTAQYATEESVQQYKSVLAVKKLTHASLQRLAANITPEYVNGLSSERLVLMATRFGIKVTETKALRKTLIATVAKLKSPVKVGASEASPIYRTSTTLSYTIDGVAYMLSVGIGFQPQIKVRGTNNNIRTTLADLTKSLEDKGASALIPEVTDFLSQFKKQDTAPSTNRQQRTNHRSNNASSTKSGPAMATLMLGDGKKAQVPVAFVLQFRKDNENPTSKQILAAYKKASK